MNFITTKEAAAIVGCHHKSLTRLVRQYGVKPIRLQPNLNAWERSEIERAAEEHREKLAKRDWTVPNKGWTDRTYWNGATTQAEHEMNLRRRNLRRAIQQIRGRG